MDQEGLADEEVSFSEILLFSKSSALLTFTKVLI